MATTAPTGMSSFVSHLVSIDRTEKNLNLLPNRGTSACLLESRIGDDWSTRAFLNPFDRDRRDAEQRRGRLAEEVAARLQDDCPSRAPRRLFEVRSILCSHLRFLTDQSIVPLLEL